MSIVELELLLILGAAAIGAFLEKLVVEPVESCAGATQATVKGCLVSALAARLLLAFRGRNQKEEDGR